MITNINPYNEEDFKKSFQETKLFKKLTSEFDLITFSTNNYTHIHHMEMCPREYRGIRIVSAVPFWFINQFNDNPIYDLGCGWNLYKRYYNVTGIDMNGRHADIVDTVDDEYIANHQQAFDNIITMNALHHYPLSMIKKRILDITSMAKPDSSIFIMFNIIHMIKHLDNTIKPKDASVFIRTELEFLKHQVISFELDDDHINDNLSEGTMRILLKT